MARASGVKAIAGVLAIAIGILLQAPVLAAGGAAPVPFSPRFATLRADRVNLHVGPGERYPVEWVYVRKDWPVEVFGQLEHWRHIRDWQGTEGWVHEKMVTLKREVIVTGGVRGLRQSPDLGAPLVARAEPGVMARLTECRGGWCRIEAGELAGWVERGDVWGVYPNETVP